MNIEMDERAAWRDFYDNYRPTIWESLPRKDRQAVNTAERDYHGTRRQKDGQAYTLGPDRVGRLLERLAPGRYLMERRVVFKLSEQKGV